MKGGYESESKMKKQNMVQKNKNKKTKKDNMYEVKGENFCTLASSLSLSLSFCCKVEDFYKLSPTLLWQRLTSSFPRAKTVVAVYTASSLIWTKAFALGNITPIILRM